jgi:ubiquitin-protein ligase
MRLENEWRRLQRAFAYHPHVRIIPLHGDPPDQYQVEYRLRTLIMPEGGALEYTASSAVHIWLPPAFPHEPPLVRPISALFHPNVAADGIRIDHVWKTAISTLAEVVSAVGEMLAYQQYDTSAVFNPTAIDWVMSNPEHVPVDPAANLSGEAGGDPLARICRFGPRTLEQIRAQLKQMVDSVLAAEGAPTALETKMFCLRTRQALGVFLEDDVPEDLRAPAAELDEWARQMPDSMVLWEVLRRYRSAAGEAFAVAGQLKDSEKALTHEIVAIDALVSAEIPHVPAKAMRIIPPGQKLQMHLGNLVNLIGRAEGAVNEARTAAGKLAALPLLTPKKTTGTLQKRVEAEVNRASAHATEASEKLNSAYSFHDPVLGRARVHVAALKRANDWREYADMVDRAEELVAKIMDWGAAGLQAYYIDNASGTFGPFELEQKLTMGASSLAVRNPASTIIEVIDADTGSVIKRADNGAIVKNITDPQTGEKFPSTFRLTGNCDELSVQLDYLARESSLMMKDLVTKTRSPDGWLGKVLDVLGTNLSKIQHEHDERRKRWRALRDDLTSLRPFKERVATVRLLQRTAELAPQMVARIAEAKNAQKAATDRVAAIVASCDTDIETGRLLIPSRFAKEYPDQLHKRDAARALIEQLQKHARAVAADVRKRISDPQLKGFADRPALAILGPIPQTWVELEAEIGDAAINEKLAELEGPLGADLRKPQEAAEAAAQQKRSGARSHIPEPALGEELVDDSEENEDLGVGAEDDLVDFGFGPEKQ